MKRYLLLTAFFFITSLLVNGQTNDEQTIRKTLTELADAFKKADISTLNRMYADDFIFISPLGVKYTKAERLANIKTIPPPEAFSYENPQIRFYDNIAVVNSEVKIKPNGQELQTHLATTVFVKKNGKWLAVNGQGTRKSGNP